MTDDLEIKAYSAEDIPALRALWLECFEDEPMLVDSFFELLPTMGSGLAAFCEGSIAGAAYVLDAELKIHGKITEKLGYIYAVGVTEQKRSQGIGEKLVKACKAHCHERGIELVCTLPASASLYKWYEKTGNLFAAGYCRYEYFPAGRFVPGIEEISPREYAERRERILSEKNYVNLSPGALEFQGKLFKTYSGGFYAYRDGIACGYAEGDELLIKELLNDVPGFIPALCTKLGSKRASVRLGSSEGDPYIAACPPSLYPSDTVWDLTLD